MTDKLRISTQATNESTRESTMGFLHKLSAAVGWEAKAMQFCAELMRCRPEADCTVF